MTEWMPIETAPKDGTPILLAGGHDDNIVHVGLDDANRLRSPCRAWWSDGNGWIIALAEAGYVAVCRENPTHWRHLSHPPIDGEQR